jgi:hypothetical protein
MIAAVLGTVLGNPVTFPFFFSATYWVGAQMQDFAAADPTEGFRIIIEGLDKRSEVEADSAADAVLDAAEDIIDSGWTFIGFDVIWPVLSVMLVGSLLVVPVLTPCSTLRRERSCTALARVDVADRPLRRICALRSLTVKILQTRVRWRHSSN